MPVAVALGGNPVYAYSAIAPLPENVDEYMLAGFLRKKKVELVKCISQPDIEVPADADFIIGGLMDPAGELWFPWKKTGVVISANSTSRSAAGQKPKA